MTSRTATWAPALVLLGGCLLTGCGGAAPAAAPAPVPVPSGGAACPPPAATSLAWPAGVPADLPKPPGAVLTSSNTSDGGLMVVRFSTSDSLRNGVISVIQMLPSAGYTLGRGDAEAAEADAPFTRGTLRGVYRMLARQPCATDWLLALTTAPTASAVPLLPARPGSASPSPLPFG